MNAALFLIGSCVVGAFIIEARAHYLLNKAMHRNVTALMDVAPDSEGSQSHGKDSKQTNYEQFGHFSSLP